MASSTQTTHVSAHARTDGSTPAVAGTRQTRSQGNSGLAPAIGFSGREREAIYNTEQNRRGAEERTEEKQEGGADGSNHDGEGGLFDPRNVYGSVSGDSWDSEPGSEQNTSDRPAGEVNQNENAQHSTQDARQRRDNHGTGNRDRNVRPSSTSSDPGENPRPNPRQARQHRQHANTGNSFQRQPYRPNQSFRDPRDDPRPNRNGPRPNHNGPLPNGRVDANASVSNLSILQLAQLIGETNRAELQNHNLQRPTGNSGALKSIQAISKYSDPELNGDPQDHIKSILVSARTGNWDDATKCDALFLSLQGRAKLWADEREEFFFAAQWEEIKNHFIENLRGTDWTRKVRRKFAMIRQKTAESVVDYASRFRAAFQHHRTAIKGSIAHTLDDEIDQFTDGLLPKLRGPVRRAVLSTFLEAERLAQVIEADEEESPTTPQPAIRPTTNFNPTPYSTFHPRPAAANLTGTEYDDEVTHLRRELEQMRSQQPEQMRYQQPEQRRYQQSSHCFHCGRQGHFVSSCPDKPRSNYSDDYRRYDRRDYRDPRQDDRRRETRRERPDSRRERPDERGPRREDRRRDDRSQSRDRRERSFSRGRSPSPYRDSRDRSQSRDRDRYGGRDRRGRENERVSDSDKERRTSQSPAQSRLD